MLWHASAWGYEPGALSATAAGPALVVSLAAVVFQTHLQRFSWISVLLACCGWLPLCGLLSPPTLPPHTVAQATEEAAIQSAVAAWAPAGASVSFVVVDGLLAGALAVRDEVRPSAAAALGALAGAGVTCAMLTGGWVRG
jgi:hypothetical protein